MEPPVGLNIRRNIIVYEKNRIYDLIIAVYLSNIDKCLVFAKKKSDNNCYDKRKYLHIQVLPV